MADNIYEGIPTPEERGETFADSIIGKMEDGVISIDDDLYDGSMDTPVHERTRPSDFDLDALPGMELERGSHHFEPAQEKVLYLHERSTSAVAVELNIIGVRLNGIELALAQQKSLLLKLLGEGPEDKAHTELSEEEPPKPAVKVKKRAPGRPKRRKPKTKIPQRGKRKVAVLKKAKPKVMGKTNNKAKTKKR